MRRVSEGIFALLLFTPALWALDDTKEPKKPDTPLAAQGKTPAEQYEMIVKDFQKEQKEFFEAYRKATPEERKKLQYPGPQKYAGRMLELANKNGKDPAAIDALVWAAQHAGGGDEGKKALTILLRDHLDSKQLAGICQTLRYFGSDVEKTLRAILEKSPHPEVQAQACFALGQYLKGQAERTKASTAEAEKLLERVAKEHPDVEIYGRKLGSLARGELFELRNLAIGKTAPDIEGEDIDGKKFKLSDYRGKVVLLDFWGNW
jgi:hypothetical protein